MKRVEIKTHKEFKKVHDSRDKCTQERHAYAAGTRMFAALLELNKLGTKLSGDELGLIVLYKKMWQALRHNQFCSMYMQITTQKKNNNTKNRIKISLLYKITSY